MSSDGLSTRDRQPAAGRNEHFGNGHEATRTLYRGEFGAAPPADLWPIRFSSGKRYQRTGAARHWIIPNPSFGAVLPGVCPLLLDHKTGY